MAQTFVDSTSYSREWSLLSSPSREAATIVLPYPPNTLEELAATLSRLGRDAKILPLTAAGPRTFGILGRLLLDNQDCVAKIVGTEPSSANGDDYQAFQLRANGVREEYLGLIQAPDVTPRLIAVLQNRGELIGVVKEFVPGEPICAAIAAGRIDKHTAYQRACELAEALAQKRLWLWDIEPDNLWYSANGEVLLIEGQCILLHAQTVEILSARNQSTIDSIFSSHA